MHREGRDYSRRVESFFARQVHRSTPLWLWQNLWFAGGGLTTVIRVYRRIIAGAAVTRRRVLTDSQVREIRALHRPGVRGVGYESLARRFGVGASTIRDIITYRSRA
jgi:hypothetical protein